MGEFPAEETPTVTESARSVSFGMPVEDAEHSALFDTIGGEVERTAWLDNSANGEARPSVATDNASIYETDQGVGASSEEPDSEDEAARNRFYRHCYVAIYDTDSEHDGIYFGEWTEVLNRFKEVYPKVAAFTAGHTLKRAMDAVVEAAEDLALEAIKSKPSFPTDPSVVLPVRVAPFPDFKVGSHTVSKYRPAFAPSPDDSSSDSSLPDAPPITLMRISTLLQPDFRPDDSDEDEDAPAELTAPGGLVPGAPDIHGRSTAFPAGVPIPNMYFCSASSPTRLYTSYWQALSFSCHYGLRDIWAFHNPEIAILGINELRADKGLRPLHLKNSSDWKQRVSRDNTADANKTPPHSLVVTTDGEVAEPPLPVAPAPFFYYPASWPKFISLSYWKALPFSRQSDRRDIQVFHSRIDAINSLLEDRKRLEWVKG
ncbi:hypothetical protein CYLTODRAFT_495148 [Cylindrobasidium torrendii FP15055 ss-10]|uniref:Uncharacterized protein n=1 Tax=Cylindrobasidium torrendii FP15055 ss-10 TaxID=1314674 RepID=A0A0D7ATF1_9AGAR|nr:hypothetical protein CYLTODRAFT_495148 [Cylindrobasidium torrendii FP15055 ss-10]